MSKLRKIGGIIDFIEYVSKNMDKKDLFLLYKVNSVKRERLEMYSDFTNHLNELVITTYLGDDIMTENDRLNHFNWCWGQVIDAFKKEGIYFVESDDLYTYFLTFYQESFYNENKEDGDEVIKFSDFWDHLFDYHKAKTMSEYEAMLEIYKIFNKSFVVN